MELHVRDGLVRHNSPDGRLESPIFARFKGGAFEVVHIYPARAVPPCAAGGLRRYLYTRTYTYSAERHKILAATLSHWLQHNALRSTHNL